MDRMRIERMGARWRQGDFWKDAENVVSTDSESSGKQRVDVSKFGQRVGLSAE